MLLPKGWHFSTVASKDGLAYRVTREEPSREKGFLTGLTVNVIHGVKKKSKADPSLYAAYHVENYLQEAKVISKPKLDRSGRFARIQCEVEKELPAAAEGLFRIRMVTLANDETDLLYVLIFGAPSDRWEQDWKIGRQLFDPIELPHEPAEVAGKVVSAKVNSIRLYVPTGELPARLGDDPKLISNYVKAVEKAAATALASADKPEAKGLFLTVGMKPNKTTRAWCQAVEGEVPDELLRKIEKEVAKVEPCQVKKGTMAFALELNLWGQKVQKFPEFPDPWLEAAKKSDVALVLVPPDELFKLIWPD
jgi:hypothetical protein